MSAELAARAVSAILACLPGSRPLALHEPAFGDAERRNVLQCIDTGWVSSAGSFVDEFERRLADFAGVHRAVATVNGTAALQVALLLAGVQPGDEVLVPSLTFIATANAVSYCGAMPHFVDCDEATLGVGAEALEDYLASASVLRDGACLNAATGARIRALVVMHTFGNPAEMDRLTALCRDRGIALVEDAAEALGSGYRGRHVGGDGLVSALSFNGNKIVTTGGGGAILTNDPELAARAKHLTTTARVAAGWNFVHDEIGYNFRMPNLNAALGCGQLDRLPGFLARKRSLAERYREALSGIRGLRLFEAPPHMSPNHWLNALVLDEAESAARDEILRLLNDGGVQARPVWTLMHRLPMYATCPRMPLAVAESLERRIVNLPSSAALA